MYAALQNSKRVLGKVVTQRLSSGRFSVYMDYIERYWKNWKEWAGKLIEALQGPEVQPEQEMIPSPVEDRPRRLR